jgi:hypothetical protein
MILLSGAAGALLPAPPLSGEQPARVNPLAIGELLCEYRKNPVSIGTVTPRLTWELLSSDG